MAWERDHLVTSGPHSKLVREACFPAIGAKGAEGSDIVQVLGYAAGGLDEVLDSAAVTGDVLACVEAGGAGAVRSGAVGRC